MTLWKTAKSTFLKAASGELSRELADEILSEQAHHNGGVLMFGTPGWREDLRHYGEIVPLRLQKIAADAIHLVRF